jgi:hypothetical protein
MKRILLHLAISIFAFGLGVGVSALWRSYTSINTLEPLRADFIADTFDELPYPVVTREEAGIACGSSTIYTHYYYLSNGGEISRSCRTYSSAAEANSVLQARRGSPYTVEWSVNVNSNGQPVGETVLILESPNVVRLSTHLGRLCETRASSMSDMRWFENHNLH